MTLLEALASSLAATVRDVLPIALVIVVAQVFVLRRSVPDVGRVVLGFVYVVAGLAVFLVGLELGLFPLGQKMARQLASPAFLQLAPAAAGHAAPWHAYGWTYLFAFSIGFSATIAEPALIAVALKANQVSGGTINVWGLRVAVAIGAGIGVALGTLRIVTGVSLPHFMLAGYCFVVIQTWLAPRQIVPLAFDSGGVTTSTVTVPLVTALGLGLAEQIPSRDPLVDGFGLIALAVLFPMITVMGYAQLAHFWTARARRPSPPPTASPSSPPSPEAA